MKRHLAYLLSFLLAFALFWALLVFRHYQGKATTPGVAPTPLALPEVASLAEHFDFPLDEKWFGAYIPRVSGLPPVDTRFGAQNPGLGSAGKCFVSVEGEPIPFGQLYHAGEDWFALNKRGRVVLGKAAGAPVYAVANGVVTSLILMGYDGYVLIVAHALPEDTQVWSVYWHIADVQVAEGEAVALGQMLGFVHDRGLNSHLHWEIRTFADGSALYSPDTAGGRGTCNGYVTGVGYTWDDVTAQAIPDAWGYLDPVAFIEAHKR